MASSAQTPECVSLMLEKEQIDINYDSYIDKLQEHPAECFRTTDRKKRKVSFVGVIGSSFDVRRACEIVELVDKEWGCTECVKRSKNYAQYVFKGGPHFCQYNSELLCESTRKAGHLVKETYKSINKGALSEWWLQTVTADMQDSPTHVGKMTRTQLKTNSFYRQTTQTVSEDWKHHYIPFDSVSDDDVDVVRLNRAFKRYSILFLKMFMKMTDLDAFNSSLELFETIIGEVTYAKTLLPSTKLVAFILFEL